MNKNLLSTNLGRRWRLPVLTLSLALALILLVAVASHAGRGAHSLGSGLQLYNLDSQPADFTANFYKPNGDLQHSFDGVIQPGCNAYYELDPETVLTGTVRVQTDQEIVGVDLHLATQEFYGNETFEMVSDADGATFYVAPTVARNAYGFNSRIMVGNLASTDTDVTIDFYEPSGAPIASVAQPVAPNGTWIVYLEDVAELYEGFHGQALISADQPVWVDVMQQSNDQIATYAAPNQAGPELYLPYVPTYLPGEAEIELVLHNLGGAPAEVTVCSTGGDCITFPDIPELGSTMGYLTPTIPDAYTITSNGEPIAAVVRVWGTGGMWSYAALPPERATRYQYAPMVFNGYQGLNTTLWVFNPAPTYATVDITFTGTLTPGLWRTGDDIPPGELLPFTPPPDQDRYAAQVNAGVDGTVFVVVEGLLPGEDGRFTYRATDSPLAAPPCQPTQVPTLTEWGYIILAAAIVLIAGWTLHRRLRLAQGAASQS